MKRSIFLTALFSFLYLGIVSATNIIIIVKDPPPDPDPLRSVLYDIPVSASINESQLAVYFELPVGVAAIAVYDEYNQLVCQQTVDTDETSQAIIPADEWTPGSYTLTITYDDTTLQGDFLTE